MKIKRLYYELIYKLSLNILNFGFSVGWWWLVDKMIEVRKATIPKLLKIIIPKEISESSNQTVSNDGGTITITRASKIKKQTIKKNAK